MRSPRVALAALGALAASAGACGDREVASPEEIAKRAGSAGPRIVRVPDVVGKPRPAATAQLRRARLGVRVRRRASERRVGLVIAQDPRARGEAETGTAVTIYVSSGSQAPATKPSGPHGTLATTHVGPVSVGMDERQVLTLFGAPERKEEVNFGAGPTPQIDWIWTFPDGKFRLQFETRGGTVTGYVCDTSNLATSSGARVGGSFAPIRERYGGQLTESPIGTPVKGDDGTWLLSENEPGSHPALTFTVDGGAITHIAGGESQAAGE